MRDNLSILIKPASSMCNMKCHYCFYFDIAYKRHENNNALMTKEVMQRIVDSAFTAIENNGTVNFSFQGGEPTLASIDYFHSFVDYVKSKKVKNKINYSIQTNGLLINEDFAKFFKDNNFLVGLSLDIIESINDKYRIDKKIDSKGNGTFYKILEAKKLFDKYNIDYNILTVLTAELSKYPNEVYRQIKKHDFKYIQFIPCLSSLYELSDTKDNYSIKPKDFASFYNTIFRLWKDDFLKDEYYSISFFDNIISMFGGYPPFTCGLNGKCQSQIVVESNGDVYPCDFYCEDKYKIGNILNNDFESFLESTIAIDFINNTRDTHTLCKSCEFDDICNSGCKRMTKNMYIDNDNFCGFHNFLETNKKDILEIWDNIKSNY